jgi:hypothetical protein
MYGSHKFGSHTLEFFYYFFHGSPKVCEPVDHGSYITQAPNQVFRKLKFKHKIYR